MHSHFRLSLAEGLSLTVTILRFRRVDRAAAWLLTPYLAWVGFGTTLNASIWWLNRL